MTLVLSCVVHIFMHRSPCRSEYSYDNYTHEIDLETLQILVKSILLSWSLTEKVSRPFPPPIHLAIYEYLLRLFVINKFTELILFVLRKIPRWLCTIFDRWNVEVYRMKFSFREARNIIEMFLLALRNVTSNFMTSNFSQQRMCFIEPSRNHENIWK